MTQAYPLQWPEGWPRTPALERDRGWQFKSLDWRDGNKKLVTFPKARDTLRAEMQRLGAEHQVISSNHRTDRDGWPVEGDRKPADPGVAVYFMLRGRQLVMACDRFDNAAANMRSLGLAIEAMRTLERHGGGQMMERAFSGFTALPPPRSCWQVLGLEARDLQTGWMTRDKVEAAYRKGAKICHPDLGGSNAAMAELNAARDQALAEIEGAA